MAGSVSSLLQSNSHIHLDSEVCPWCEQSIPHDKFEEISARIAEEEEARIAEHEAKLRDQFAVERQALSAKAQADVSAALRSAEESVLMVRQEAEAKAAELAAETTERIEAAAAAARLAAESALAERIKEVENSAQDAARDALAAQTALKNLQESYDTQTAATNEKHKADLAAAVANTEAGVTKKLQDEIEAASVRVAAATAAEAQAKERIAAVENERTTLKQQLDEVNAAHEADILQRTNEVRESLGREMSKAVADERANAFAKEQRLTETVDSLKRQLEQKTAAELGEGSEIDLHLALKERFPDDIIRRVPKGENGADVIHEVIDNGIVCGKIVYDSKNRGAWQNNFVTKLRSDMIAEKADHAILSTNKFPAGVRQLHMQDGVIVACPARVVALAELLRSHIVQSNALRMSAEQREEKTAKLYDYITSEPCTQLLNSMQTAFERLDAIDADEKKAHDLVWNKRGKLIKDLERTRGSFVFELHRIIGTAEAAE